MRLDRLMILRDHMLYGDRGHKNFDFSCFNNTYGRCASNKCGTNGCMAGELPIIWPKYWEFNFFGEVNLRNKTPGLTTNDLMKFFDLEHHEVQHLFYPNMQYSNYTKKQLTVDSTLKEVVNNLEKFIKIKLK